MAHYTKAAGFPNVPLVAGMKIRLRALDPTADGTVGGVTVSQFAIYGRDDSEGPPPPPREPRWLPEEVDPYGGIT